MISRWFIALMLLCALPDLAHSSSRTSYGDREVLTGNSSNDQWYTGKLQDQNSLLVNMGARQYHPLLGRFTSTDPVTPNADNWRTFNRYAHANNNPYKFTDPDGRSPVDIAFLVADTVKLASAIASGNPAAVTSAAIDVGLSVVGTVSPVPGTGQAIKAVRVADKAVDSTRGGAQIFERVVSNAELKATQETGFLRGGRSGENFFTSKASLDAKRSQQRLGLDGPLRDQRIQFEIKSDVTVSGPRVAAGGRSGTSGGGVNSRRMSQLG